MKRTSSLCAASLLVLGGPAYATSIPIPDFSFEDPVVADGSSVNVSDSTFGNAWTANLFVNVDHPTGNGVGTSGETWSTPVPDGNNVLHLLAAGDPYGVQVDQVIPNNFIAGQTYTFSVWVGNSFQNDVPMHYAIRIFGENGATTKYLQLSTDQTNPVANGQWLDVVGTYTVQPNDPLIGSGHLEFNLTNGLGYDPQPGQDDVFFDDIQASVVTPLTWNNTGASGDGVTWDASNQNWNNGASPQVYSDGSPVQFTDTNNSHYAVTLNSVVQPASVVVNSNAGNYVISGSGGINGTTSLTKLGTSTLTLSTVNTYTGGTTVSAGKLIAGVKGALPDGNLTINGTGEVQLASNTGTATFTSLTIGGTNALDIGNNRVILSYSGASPIGLIAAYIATGYAKGAWNGPGIISSAAAANPGVYGIGYADAADPGNPANLASGTIEIEYTLLGDADLNGIVNGIDFGILAANFNKGVNGWDQGDFDYNGIVNGIDFGYLAANFNKGSNGASERAALYQFAAVNGLLAYVPEPASVGSMMAISFAMLGQRIRRRVRP